MDFVSAHVRCANTNTGTELSAASSSVFSLLPGQQTAAHEQQAAVCI